MINYHETLVAALEEVLPGRVHYEMTLHQGLETPCISYMEGNNYDYVSGDTLGYSSLNYVVKVWGEDVSALQRYALEIDRVLRPLGWRRVSCAELQDNNSAMVQKVMTYEALALETFN